MIYKTFHPPLTLLKQNTKNIKTTINVSNLANISLKLQPLVQSIENQLLFTTM